ncbi:methyltransferase domain-containing protein [Mesorhizobium sp. NZP2077]|uniref:methyltransferase domain-containing protein n=1 Tax=Mesorhizobium sp. NZP2077 TaxID=2483404 RepID=UPI0015581EBE|nr:methyltransferase domain-containing protein [Mesorhizobium sp. NZP2077]QKC83266.1 methyltransferase domain-containing protein [Mesorhizobium sp. NZP2077]QKD16782.1 methyltransferase domain-containing protein [Mesorhizobium sp. NZP2077]
MAQLVRDWEGETAFVLAGGPSVRNLDLSLLKGRRVIAVNSAHLAYPDADALYYADSDWWMRTGSKEPPFAGEIFTTNALGGPKSVKRLVKVDPGRGVSIHPGRIVVSATSVSGAMNILTLRGVARIVLLGVDGCVGADGRRHHHDGRYPDPLRKGGFERHRRELEALAPSIRKLGVEVINCSPVSHVACWPKVPFGDVISMLDRVAVKPPLTVLSMYGIGDNLHQRAVLRELMKTHDVELQTYYTSMFHDLEAEGLKVTLVAGKLDPRINDRGNTTAARKPVRSHDRKIGYDHAATKRHGTLLAAMFGSVGLPVPERPDFSLPVKPEWREAARALIGDTSGKPIMVYRPIVINATWSAPARSPDPAAYAALYGAIKDRFFTVSVCNLTQKGEEIVGEEQPADLKLHHGEADFETLAGLFAEAALVFGNAGFTPILAQAVGTPNIVVYGGNESYRFTNIVGAHLAPTLPIEPVKPCECFDRHHKCDKTIDLAKAVPLVEAFATEHAAMARILVFGTTYVDTPAKAKLAEQWQALHETLNPGAHLLLVDSASPEWWFEDGSPKPDDTMPGCQVYSFPDNIGHLARGGKDGWGRAFSKGLEMAIDGQYDYVVHIEGDSLFSKPVLPIIRKMMADGVKAASVPVEGTKRKETGWAETGLMFFSVDYLWQSKFIERYDWWNRSKSPTPEKVIFDLIGEDLCMLPLKAERGDRGQLTAANAAGFDWITHCAPEALDAFVEAAMPPPPVEIEAPAAQIEPAVKLNFGCGTNRLDGWQNFDAEIDITKPLPFADDHADFIYAEHVVEHVDYVKALAFFAECRRVLKPGGVIRICVPSLENIWKRGDQAYCDFTRRWGPTADLRGAMHAIIFAHGHKAIWSQGLLEAALYFAGFDGIEGAEVHKSSRVDLTNVEGHHTVIGEHFNWIEAAIAEGRK